jgi:hypothetical protein
VLVGIAVAGYIGLLVLLDLMFVLSITYPLVFWVVGLCFAVVFWFWPGKPRLVRLMLVGFVVAMALGIRAIEYQNVPIKSFVQDLYSIQPGMRIADVERIMGKYPRGTGWPANILAGQPPEQELTIPGALVFRPSTDGGDSNWGIVRIREGRVATVEFSPD